MFKFFKPRRPVSPFEPPRISPQDSVIAVWHGYNETQWAELPSIVQIDKRESFYQAQGLGS
jgi:hypothetical protein